MQRVLVANGPNLNLLGEREPEVYGDTTLAALDQMCREWGEALGLDIETFQSNHEGELIDRLHSARASCAGVVLNAGALTHYSRALGDAITAAALPTVEVHISNIHAREEWRRTSVISGACVATIFGRGVDGYRWALRHLSARLEHEAEEVAYGPGPDHVGDLRLPDGPGPHPVVVLLHGGFWAEVWQRDLMDLVAVDLPRRGWATWNVEYRRVGTGGGWPHTMDDARAAIDHLDDLGAVIDLGRVVVVGHSAGGQLALVAAARGGRVPLAGVVALAPVTDLAAAHDQDLGPGAVAAFLRRPPDHSDGRYEAASPELLIPIGVPQEIIHGTHDDRVPVAMTDAYVAAARVAGDTVRFTQLPGEGHFGYLDPESSAWAAATAAISRLVAR